MKTFWRLVIEWQLQRRHGRYREDAPIQSSRIDGSKESSPRPDQTLVGENRRAKQRSNGGRGAFGKSRKQKNPKPMLDGAVMHRGKGTCMDGLANLRKVHRRLAGEMRSLVVGRVNSSSPEALVRLRQGSVRPLGGFQRHSERHSAAALLNTFLAVLLTSRVMEHLQVRGIAHFTTRWRR